MSDSPTVSNRFDPPPDVIALDWAYLSMHSLAVTRENRFIPLKDGVWDPEYERSLLGADVHAIVDALSLGWYESLLQSYMATKVITSFLFLVPD